MSLAVIYIESAFFQFVAAWKSLSFVWTRRLGRVWSLVSLALLLKGGLSLWSAFSVPLAGTGFSAYQVPVSELFISILLAGGFILTGEWFRFKERLEARIALIAEVERSLVGVLEEDRIYSMVCGILSRSKGYRLAWVGAPAPDGSVCVEHSAGGAQRFLSETSFRWDDTPEGRTPPGVSLRTGETGVWGKSRGEGDPPGFRERSLRHGLRSCMSARIEQTIPPHKVLTVHADSSAAFDPGVILAFSAMAGRVGAAVQSARRHQAFADAKSSYDDLLRNQRDGVLLVRGGKVVRANPSAAAMLGFSSPDLLFDEDPAALLADPEASPGLRDAVREGGGIGTRGEWEAAILRRDGSRFAGEITVTWVSRDNRRGAPSGW
jgi:PAS domain-containing protein